MLTATVQACASRNGVHMFSRPRYLTATLIAALLLVAGATAGCFGGGDDTDVNKLLDQVFDGNQKLNSGKLDMEISANLEGAQVSGPVSVKVSGPFEGLEEKVKDTNRLPRADLNVTVSAAGQQVQAGGTSTGDKLYVNYRGQDYVVPDRLVRQFKSQLEEAQAQSNSSQRTELGALGISPKDWLENPKDEGKEEVAGVETVHISSDVNVNELLADFDRLLKRAKDLGLSAQQLQQLPQGIPPSVRKQIRDSIGETNLDLFVDETDHILRKLELTLKFDLPADLSRQAGGLDRGELKFAYEIADVNEPQTITAPESARPLRELQRMLRGSALGGVGSGSSVR
jgi:hypothetical protein